MPDPRTNPNNRSDTVARYRHLSLADLLEEAADAVAAGSRIFENRQFLADELRERARKALADGR